MPSEYIRSGKRRNKRRLLNSKCYTTSESSEPKVFVPKPRDSASYTLIDEPEKEGKVRVFDRKLR